MHVAAGLVWYSLGSKCVEQLTDDQKKVFYDVYYRGRTIAVISAELNETEDLIRKTLKEAFTIMKKNGEN
ncbi:sigma factor-like helix-turn-helix DNA-binding protein [Pedobacter sp. L105]|uniref:sigma factor-like helix-turn-helix DNA-binding protein n=1 Tax=Pedobacter sp. L105 TaxID=1641871 RepID=UPI00352A6D94